MEEGHKKILEKIFDLNLDQDSVEIIEELEEEIATEVEIQIEEYKEDNNEIILNYSLDDEEKRVTALSIAAGLPNEEFEIAETLYKEVVDKKKEDDEEYEYLLEGSSLKGALVQYATIMSQGVIKYNQATTYNALGIENFLKFQGNEFLGLKLGLLYYLNELLYENRSMMREILYKFENKGIIKYGNISKEYKKACGNKIKSGKIKKELVKVLIGVLEMEKEEVEELVEENFATKIIERKMRFINRYQKYKEENEQKINNYILSENLTARLFKHVGETYLVDKGLKKQDRVDKELIQLVERLEEDKLEDLIESSNDLFFPFLLLEEGGNGKHAKNRFRQEPEIGEITDRLSNDYLQALIKDIIFDIQAEDENLLTEIFKRSRQTNGGELKDIIEDRLRYSQKLKGFIKEDDLYYKSQLFEDNPEFFAAFEKTYSLDRVVIEQFNKMGQSEIEKLWDWKLSGDGVFMILGTEVDDEEVIEYHDKEESFDNEQEELEIELEEPSQNKIYGSIKKSANYTKELDQDYHYNEEDSYNFSSQQGAGFIIDCRWSNPDYKAKVDGDDISGVYQETDREEADIGEREVTLRDKYFGEDIILRNAKKFAGELSGDLIYLYGDNKEDELIIAGFKNGDYGIELEAKIAEEDEAKPKSYTSHKIKFANLEFEVLAKLEIIKEIYQHSKVVVKGLINAENKDDYQAYLEQKDVEIEITYLEESDEEILFKGIVKEYKISYSGQDYHLELKAISYSSLLEKRQVDRIYQNQGSTYSDVFELIEEDNSEFNILFADDSLGDEELVSEDYPVVLQYQENEWDFLRRIISYTDQILVVDDSKDDSESINILAGTHDAAAIELNNSWGNKLKKTDKRGESSEYYQVNNYVYSEPQIFKVGSFVKYNLNRDEDETKQLVVSKNRIYNDKGLLRSDLTLVAEEKIEIRNRKRRVAIAGKSFKAEIKEVTEQYTAQVEFLALADDFDDSSAHYYPIDKIYTGAYLAPEEGDIVDIYFASKNEKSATVKNSSSDLEEIEHEPDDKLITSKEGYQLELNDEHVLLADADEESSIELTEDEISTECEDNKLEISGSGIELSTDDATVEINKAKLELSVGSKSITFSKAGIDLG